MANKNIGKNIIFYFSGTGNCLQVSREIATKMSNCEIVPMGSSKEYNLRNEYDSVGFVYPTYFLGIPLKVKEFVSKLNLMSNKKTYFYAITTCGAFFGNALSQLENLLNKKNILLNYGVKLVMFSNYVIMYDMSKKVKEKTNKSDKNLALIVENIKKRISNKIRHSNAIIEWYYNMRAKKIPMMDKNFTVSSSCISCGICRDVCPVENIEIVDNKPNFKNHCEQCVACIQFCPKKSINYKKVTQKRGRYTNPTINYKELAQSNKNKSIYK